MLSHLPTAVWLRSRQADRIHLAMADVHPVARGHPADPVRRIHPGVRDPLAVQGGLDDTAAGRKAAWAA